MSDPMTDSEALDILRTVTRRALQDSPTRDAFDHVEERLRALAQPAEAVEGDAYEVREDGERVRKDRWETGFRNIVTVLFGPRTEFEIDDVVERVRSLANQAHDAAQGAVACDVVDPDGSAVALRVDIEYADELLQEYKYSDCRKTNYLYTHPQAAPAQVPLIARAKAEWHEDDGAVMWWAWCGHEWAGEPAWCGTPNDSDWPGYHTHWTSHPKFPAAPTQEGE